MSISCNLCPNNCYISENSFGICGVRGCKNDKIHLPFQGLISSAGNDPIEKKPLYHFHPGKNIFSIGFYGCNLTCPFCQNFRISREFKSSLNTEHTSIDSIIDSAQRNGSFGIAYTYSEPVIHFEWIKECAGKARSVGLKNVLVTNGYINKEYSRDFLKDIDAVNIDLKSFTDEFYRKELGGTLEPVLNFIRLAANTVHTELTTLVIPGKNDGFDEIEAAAGFIKELNINIPWHLSAYYPSYKYNIPPTPSEHLLNLAAAASEHLNFVYTGNSSSQTITICPSCGSTLITHNGYLTSLTGISRNKCTSCGADVSDFGIIL